MDLNAVKPVVIKEVDDGQSCFGCGDKCTGFKAHSWRNICMTCKCPRDYHDIYHEEFVDVRDRLGWEAPKDPNLRVDKEKTLSEGYAWIPPGISVEKIEEYMDQLDNNKIPKLNMSGEKYRSQQLVTQLPCQDLCESYCKFLKAPSQEKGFHDFIATRDATAMDVANVREYIKEDMNCKNCEGEIEAGEMAVIAPQMSSDICWHPACFVCFTCEELLVDLVYCHKDDHIYCERHYAELIKPRCAACDELIFSGEYTKAMDQDFHNGHFACFDCDMSLTGHRYILREEHPYCIKCYEKLFANTCEDCKNCIGIDSKDLSYKEKHWHEKCFKCSDCQKSLVDQPFASKNEKLYCADCHDNNFAARCDGCENIFRAGMKKFEYKGKQWHEECFCCKECKQPIGTKSFIPREQEVICVPCYEKEYAQRCGKCNETINKGGITYKGIPFHRECFTCTNCNKELAGEKFTSRDEKPYCADCFGELFAKRCCRCGKPITGLGGTKFISFEERHWHSDCFNCYKCDLSLVGRGFLVEGEDILCPPCGRA